MTLERIEITPFAVIVGDILQQRRTGRLSIIQPPLHKVLHFVQGELVMLESAKPEDSLADFLVRRGAIPAERGAAMAAGSSTDAVALFHEEGILDLSTRQTLLRDRLSSQFLPLFSLDEGTAAFTEETAIEPDKRVFLQSTAALLLEGIRSVANGLILRRSLGDLKREIEPSRDSRFGIESVPLLDNERRIADALTGRQTVEAFLKQFSHESITAARVVIGMTTLGLFVPVDYRSSPAQEVGADDMQRDLELLAAIGSSDPRSLRAVALSRQLGSLDHYQVLDVPRNATRAQIVSGAETVQKRFEVASYPPIARDSVVMINRRIDEALGILKDSVRRQAYDKLLTQRTGGGGGAELQKRVTQRAIAEQNFYRARDLSTTGDYYGAILLLKQAVEFAPDHAAAWYLLGACQERNPNWRREAAESVQRSLSLDPNNVEALISLGDIYKAEGLASRAQSCYEDVLKIEPDNPQAKSRLTGIKRR